MTAPAPDGARTPLTVSQLRGRIAYLAQHGPYEACDCWSCRQTVRVLEMLTAIGLKEGDTSLLLARPVAAPRAPSEEPVLAISEEEIELLREHAESVVESYAYPEGDACKQPTEWHEGRKLWALANRMADYFKARLAYLAGAATAKKPR